MKILLVAGSGRKEIPSTPSRVTFPSKTSPLARILETPVAMPGVPERAAAIVLKETL